MRHRWARIIFSTKFIPSLEQFDRGWWFVRQGPKFISVKLETTGHDLGQRVRIIQKRNRWADLKILSWKVSFCGFMESQESILQLDHSCSHWWIKLPMKFFAPIMRYSLPFQSLQYSRPRNLLTRSLKYPKLRKGRPRRQPQSSL